MSPHAKGPAKRFMLRASIKCAIHYNFTLAAKVGTQGYFNGKISRKHAKVSAFVLHYNCTFKKQGLTS